MKPCLNIKKIQGLIRYHLEMAVLHNEQVEFHNTRVDILNEYIHELTKPGFKQGHAIKVGGTRNSEPFVTIAGNTYTTAHANCERDDDKRKGAAKTHKRLR